MATVQTYGTVLDIVQAATRQLSILVPTGVYDSEDENALLMGSNINNIGAMLLANRRCMQQFRSTFTITGDGLRRDWDIPANYGRLINNTGWSYALRRPVRLVTPDVWAALLASQVSVTIQPVFRLMDDKFWFLNAPGNGEVITFEYVKRTWVIDGADITQRKEFCTINADKPMFDFTLMVIATKLKWRESKGFDTEADTSDFNDRMDQVYDADVPGETLSLNAGLPLFPLIGGGNLPITGYGE